MIGTSGRIPPEFIDELLSRVDIYDVVNPRVPLRKAGHEYKACCPFHDEKSPSFTVSSQKQFYHCFGCGEHGSAIGFLMAFDRLDFLEAVEDLAGMVGLEVPRVAPVGRPVKGSDYQSEQERLFGILVKANQYFKKQLRTHPEASKAIEYLKKRGLSGEVSRDYGLGFAPPGWRGLSQELGTSEENKNALMTAGLVKSGDSGDTYDRFRNRIMFPIHDRRGRITGFGGRALDDDGPKYLNSPETPTFQKGELLYGLPQTLQAERRPEQIIVVEGYLDVIALAQFGVRNVVATLGTAATSAHLKQLFRVTENLVFCFDGDEAGRRAAAKAMQTALPLMQGGRRVDFLFLPDGEDPDSLIRAIGQEEFQTIIAGKVPLSTFLFSQIESQTELTSLDGRARLVELARPLISLAPDGVYRTLLLDRLADISGLDRGQLLRQVETGKVKKIKVNNKPGRRHLGTGSMADKALQSLLLTPELANQCSQGLIKDLGEFPATELLANVLNYIQENPVSNTGSIIEQYRGTVWEQQLAQVSTLTGRPFDDTEFRDALARLVEKGGARKREELLHKDDGEFTNEEKEQFRRLYKPKKKNQ